MATDARLSSGDRLAALFPDPDAPAASQPWLRWRRVVAIAAIVVVVTTVLAARAFGSSGTDYQTAIVGRRTVDAALTGTATIQPVSQASVAFPIQRLCAAWPMLWGLLMPNGSSFWPARERRLRPIQRHARWSNAKHLSTICHCSRPASSVETRS